MEATLKDKICIVTGGSKGIGLAIVKLFAAEGARVFYFSRTRAEDHDAMEAEFAASGVHSPIWIGCDVADEAQVESAMESVIKAAGSPDCLVNNAGITRDGLVFRMSLADWESVIRTNLTSAFLTSRIAARHMIKRRSGSIVNLSSVVGIMGNGGQTNYAASKEGIIGFTKSLAKEVASRGVRVNALAPGYIDTAMTEKIGDEMKDRLRQAIPLGRTGAADEVAKAALFLCSDMASYITGEVLKVDGGMGM
jgi:3-oxoacyl-[acyl-carrier protein] reductase